ncbi:hypothetical protein L207DRAFT_642023 [Hyaloscypha variabilis F]|uniref:Uncharacterized protein n=1 Tax=Hyaloscypha variabilis (strain UAMH 11265 / GT02V1 / F) TaxID=1149755 RepID=A0A2J6QUH6_HYAVF|nr:hypothetical protein L207DRAFT_642023 [Hyaloscypha variabilis F]
MTSHDRLPSMAKYFDWDTFRQNRPSLSTELLSSCSKLNIDTNTLELAQHLCDYYPIPEVRKQERAQTVKNFTNFKLGEERKAILADDIYLLLKLTSELASTDSGLALFCICSVLGHYYPVESIVAIFAELVKEAGVPEDLVPSIQAWQSLGPLFASLGGPPMFTALADKCTALGNSAEAIDRPKVEHLGALGVVFAFHSISLMVREEQGWLLFVVGKDAGWVSAVAEWLFGLKIELRGSFREESIHGEEVLYSNCQDGMKPQLVIRFNPAGVPVDGEPIVTTPLEVKA